MARPTDTVNTSQGEFTDSADKMPNRHTTVSADNSKNPIIRMVEDKKRIIEAINNGESLSTLTGIKIVSPL